MNKMTNMMAEWEKSWAQNMNDLGENTMYEPVKKEFPFQPENPYLY